MASRTYPCGLPVMVTVHDDGRVDVEVDMSEAGQTMSETWYEREFVPDLQGVDEARMLLDRAVAEAMRSEYKVEQVNPPEWLPELKCPARWACGFTGGLAAMDAHLRDPDESHGDS